MCSPRSSKATTPAALRANDPPLDAGGLPTYFLPDAAQVRNPRHVRALVAGCASWGVHLSPGCPVVELERTRGPIARGRSFLLAQQQPGGGWPETTRPPGAQSYAQHISTSAWATLALILTRE